MGVAPPVVYLRCCKPNSSRNGKHSLAPIRTVYLNDRRKIPSMPKIREHNSRTVVNRGHEDILRLEVTMHNILVVQILHSF